MVTYRRIRITASDRAWHDAFFTHVAEVFPGIDFRRWGALGAWSKEYDVLALAQDDRIVASIGRTQMPLIVDGRETIAMQLGAVSTRAALRGGGLSRQLMGETLAEADRRSQPVFLFANPTVLDFYPLFGFRRATQSRFGADVPIAPAAARAQAFDANNAAERARLAALCQRALPSGSAFGSRSYYSILLWHLCDRPLAAYWLAGGEAFAVTSEDHGRLVLHELIAASRFDLRAALQGLATREATAIEFGFEPGAWWPEARVLGPDDAPLFVRGVDLPNRPFRFPDLAQT